MIMSCSRVLLCIVFPPLAVYDQGCGNIVITFTWSDVPAFYQYILSFGDKAEIISPDNYRKEFAEILKNMHEHYQT